jgi:hypothetical protein
MKQTLEFNPYKPNPTAHRFQKRAKSVLAWCEQFIESDRGKPIPSGEITKVFGNTTQNRLAKWLRANLLVETEKYIPGRRFNRYRVNKDGYARVYGHLGLEVPDEVEILRRRYADMISRRARPPCFTNTR